MKEKIFMFIIGLLVGAILATGGFYIYHKNNKNVSAENTTETNTEQFEKRGGKGDRMQGDFDGEEPPEMPDGESLMEKSYHQWKVMKIQMGNRDGSIFPVLNIKIGKIELSDCSRIEKDVRNKQKQKIKY